MRPVWGYRGRSNGSGSGECETCGAWTPLPRIRFCYRCDPNPEPIVCVCPFLIVDPFGACVRCHRKPARLLGVFGRAALEAAGATVQ